MVSGAQRTKNRAKLRYVGSISPKFESWGTEFNYFLKLPEVRWTPEFFSPVPWRSKHWDKLFRRENEKDFLVIIIPPGWKFGFSRILYGNWWANKVGWGFLIKKTSVRISWGASVIANNIVYDASTLDGVSAAILGLKSSTQPKYLVEGKQTVGLGGLWNLPIDKNKLLEDKPKAMT